ncbi:MAG: guanylate kinase [Rhodomicrobium sp.]
MKSASNVPSRRGVCLILSSPSGAGKTTLARALLASEAGLCSSISVTTRPPRAGEAEGVDYFFVPREKFEAMRERGELLEWAQVFGNYYGTPAQPVRDALAAGKDMILDVDWQGAASIASLLPGDTVRVFILPPSADELSRRIHGRGTDAKDVIQGRLKAAAIDISHWSEYDYVLVNNDIPESLSALKAILHAERHKRQRQRGLAEFVSRLTPGEER